MIKTALKGFGVFFAIVGGVIILLVAPIIYDGLHSSSQKRTLQHRTDYPQIAKACILLAGSLTNAATTLTPSDPLVPPTLRALSPHYIGANSNFVTLEFHGGFDHYGYRVEQSEINSNVWRMSYYTEQEHRVLVTITNTSPATTAP